MMKSFRVLVVEDSPSDVRLLHEALRETGGPIDLAVAKDGAEATEYLRQSEAGLKVRPDLVILDLNLPGKSGREVLKEIKSSPTLKQIPVVIMTSSRAPDDIMSAYSLNANCYVAKPGSLPEYMNVVRAIEDFWFMAVTLPENFPPPNRAPQGLLAAN